MEKVRVELEFGIDPFQYSEFSRHNTLPLHLSYQDKSSEIPLSIILEGSLDSDELELLKRTEREIDECRGSGRYEEAQHLSRLIQSRYGKHKLSESTIVKAVTDNQYVEMIIEKCKTIDNSQDLQRITVSFAKELLTEYDPCVSKGLSKLRDSRDEDDETDEMLVARRIFRHVPQTTIDFIIKLLLFFPAFKAKYGQLAINDTFRLRVILWVLMQNDAMSLDLGKVTVEDFRLYLRETHPN